MAPLGHALGGACVKCGATPAPHKRTVDLRWAPTWVYAMLLFSLLVAAIGYLATRKTSRHEVAICDACIGEWDASYREGAMSAAALFGSMIGGGALLAAGSWVAGATMAVVGPVFALAGAVVARRKRLTASRIDEQEAHIEGVSPNYERAAPHLALPPGSR